MTIKAVNRTSNVVVVVVGVGVVVVVVVVTIISPAVNDESDLSVEK